MRPFWNKSIVEKNKQLKITLSKLHNLTQLVQHQGMEGIITDVIDRLESPFTFVIVGEVKAGKSSFVNALLDVDQEICKVAPSPMTDTIQQIVYGTEEQIEMINPHLKKIYQPVEILKEITIVDTPGTNSIVDHHQEITERFIPYADLIVFVFEAKNPYRESAWQFFDYIHEDWRRKIIFVLQQKDLLNTDDLAINHKGVQDYAVKKGIKNPNVFDVSAKLELEGDKENSGFKDIRAFLEQNITGGKAPELKYQNNKETALKINDTIYTGIEKREHQYNADYQFREEIKVELNNQSERSKKQAAVLVENLIATYDRITSEKVEKLETQLSFVKVIGRTFRSIFAKENGLKDFLSKEAQDLEYKLNISLKEKLNAGIIDVADQIQLMCKMINSKLKSSETILKKDDSLFSDIAEKRANILKELQQSFQDFMQKTDNFYADNIQATSANVGTDLAAGGGLAVVGVILTALTNGAVLDITGGILTTVGVLFAGASLGLKRGKLLRQFKAEIKTGRTNLEQEVSEKLFQYIQSITQRMDSIFIGLDNHLSKEKKMVEELVSISQSIKQDLS